MRDLIREIKLGSVEPIDQYSWKFAWILEPHQNEFGTVVEVNYSPTLLKYADPFYTLFILNNMLAAHIIVFDKKKKKFVQNNWKSYYLCAFGNSINRIRSFTTHIGGYVGSFFSLSISFIRHDDVIISYRCGYNLNILRTHIQMNLHIRNRQSHTHWTFYKINDACIFVCVFNLLNISHLLYKYVNKHFAISPMQVATNGAVRFSIILPWSGKHFNSTQATQIRVYNLAFFPPKSPRSRLLLDFVFWRTYSEIFFSPIPLLYKTYNINRQPGQNGSLT